MKPQFLHGFLRLCLSGILTSLLLFHQPAFAVTKEIPITPKLPGMVDQGSPTPPTKGNKATTPKLFDVTISLYRSSVSSPDKQKYEEIIKYFADGVYEQSNGVHKIRTVRFFPAGKFASLSDVVWTKKGHPCAAPGGIGRAGHRVHLFDVFKNGIYNSSTSSYSDLDFLGSAANRRWCGYTFDHEWGHYFYALYDEYQGSVSSSKWIYWPLSSDENQPYSVMCNQYETTSSSTPDYRWLNFSSDGYEDKTQPSGYQKYSKKNGHYRSYGAGQWQTLIRNPSKDPKNTAARKALPKRPYYSELKGKEPSGKSLPSIELPSSDSSLPSGAARKDLQIVWMSDKVAMDIVLDKSGSMSGTRLANAQAAAKVLVDLAVKDKTALGVTSFDHTVNTSVQAMTTVTSTNKNTIKTAINGISAGGATAIGEAAKKSRSKLNTFVGTKKDSKVVLLLSDGHSNTGLAPNDATLLKNYRTDQIPIFAFGYGSKEADVDSRLKEMAKGTRGLYYFSPTTAKELVIGYTKALDTATPLDVLFNEEIKTLAPKGHKQQTTYDFFLDEDLDLLNIILAVRGDEPEPAIVKPNGDRINTPDGEYWPSDEMLAVFNIENPDRGTYTIEFADRNYDMTAIVTGQPSGERPYLLTAESLEGPDIQYPTPIVLVAELSKDLPIAGAQVEATVFNASGTLDHFVMMDDGVAPDAVADDGRYSAIYQYQQPGLHNFIVEADNRHGTARETYNAFPAKRDADGNQIPMPDDVPISDQFARSVSLQVRVYDVLPDDHENAPEEGTVIDPNDESDAGRIDWEGDIDFFQVITPEDKETLTFRVFNLSPEMTPVLEVLSSDFEPIGLFSSESGTFPAVTVPAVPGETIYAGVRHQSPEGTGYYDISVGAGTDTLLQERYEIPEGWSLVGFPGQPAIEELHDLYGETLSHAVEWMPGVGANLVEAASPNRAYFLNVLPGETLGGRALCSGPPTDAVLIEPRPDGEPAWNWIGVPTQRTVASRPEGVESVLSWMPGVGFDALGEEAVLQPWRGYVVHYFGAEPVEWTSRFGKKKALRKAGLPQPEGPHEFLFEVNPLGAKRYLGVMESGADEYGEEDLLSPPVPGEGAPSIVFLEPLACDPSEPGCEPHEMLSDIRAAEGNHVWELQFRHTIPGELTWGGVPRGWEFDLYLNGHYQRMEDFGSLELSPDEEVFSVFIEAIRSSSSTATPTATEVVIEEPTATPTPTEETTEEPTATPTLTETSSEEETATPTVGDGEPPLKPIPLCELLERLRRDEADVDELLRRIPTWYQEDVKNE